MVKGPRPAFLLFLLFLLLCALTGVARGDGTCVRDSDCKSTQLLGMVKVDAGREVVDLRDGSCCGDSISSDGCYWGPVQECSVQSDAYPRQQVCFKKGEEACGPDCCNTLTHRCQSYTEVNGFKVSKCVLRLDNYRGFWIVALPIILCLLSIVGLFATLRAVKDEMRGFKKPQRAIVLISIVAWLLGLPFHFSSAWAYGVAIALTVCVGIASLPSLTRGPHWFSVLLHIALFVAMLGWAQDNRWWSSWAYGILDEQSIYCSPRYENYFDRSGITSGKWASAAAAYRAGEAGTMVGRSWGYCSVHWWVALWVLGAIGIVLSGVLLVAHVLVLAEEKPVLRVPHSSHPVAPTSSVNIVPP